MKTTVTTTTATTVDDSSASNDGELQQLQHTSDSSRIETASNDKSRLHPVLEMWRTHRTATLLPLQDYDDVGYELLFVLMESSAIYIELV